jgi:hypothetical protein
MFAAIIFLAFVILLGGIILFAAIQTLGDHE